MSDERPSYEQTDNFDLEAWRANKNKTIMPINNEWEVRFLRESWTFPFGSLANAYGLVNQQKGAGMKASEVSIDRFTEDMRKLYNLAVEMVEDSIKRSKPKGEAVFDEKTKEYKLTS